MQGGHEVRCTLLRMNESLHLSLVVNHSLNPSITLIFTYKLAAIGNFVVQRIFISLHIIKAEK